MKGWTALMLIISIWTLGLDINRGDTGWAVLMAFCTGYWLCTGLDELKEENDDLQDR
jgi:hypothetical protein